MRSAKLIYQIAASFLFISVTCTTSAKNPEAAELKNNLLRPTPFVARYDLYRGSIKMGESDYELKKLDNDFYQLEGIASPAGLLTLFPGATASEKSLWKYVGGDIQPVKYQYALKAAMIERKMVNVFDWTKKIATVSYDDRTRKVPIKKGDLDQSLVPIAVMLDLRKGKLEDAYRYVDRRRVKDYSFKKIGREWLQTDLGLFDTVLIETIQNSKKNKPKRRTVFWGAPELDYLPVRITHQSGDDAEVVMTLTRLRGELGFKLGK